VLLVDDHEPDVVERGERRKAGPDDDVDVAGPDAAPLVGPLPCPEARVDERDAGVEVGAEAVDERQGEGDLRDEDEGRAASIQGRRDGLDVDGRLPAAGDPIEEERGGIAALDGSAGALDGLLLLVRQGGVGRTAATATDGSRGERKARTLADVAVGEAAANEACDGRRAVARGKVCRAQTFRRGATELIQGRNLPRTQPAAVGLGAGRGDPPLVARAGAGRGKRPVEGHEPLRLEATKTPHQAGATFRRAEVPDGPGAGGELVEQVRVGGRQAGRGRVGVRPALGHELEALEHLRREHRPDDERGRGEVVVGDPARERERQGRQQWAVGADAIDDRARLDARLRTAHAEHDAERLAPAVRDEDGFAWLDRLERGWNGVRPAPGAAPTDGVDGDLDEASDRLGRGGARIGRVRQREGRLVDHRPIVAGGLRRPTTGSASGSRPRPGGPGGARARWR
jgi:hypothetical protein